MKKFEKSFIGYDIDQVNHFISEVIDNVESMIIKLKERDLIIEKLSKELEEYKINKEIDLPKYNDEEIKNSIITYKRKLNELLAQQKELIKDIEEMEV